jgi:hypothetical protein
VDSVEMRVAWKSFASLALSVTCWAALTFPVLGETPEHGSDLKANVAKAQKIARNARARARIIKRALHDFPYQIEFDSPETAKLLAEERDKAVKALEEASTNAEKIAETLEDQAFSLEVDRYAALAHLDEDERQFVRAMRPVEGVGRGGAEALARFARTVDQKGLSLEKDFPYMKDNFHFLALEDFDHSGRRKALVRITGGTPGQTLLMLDPYWIEWDAAHRDQDDRVEAGKISLEAFRAEDCPISVEKMADGSVRIHVKYDDWPHDSKATTFYRYMSVLEFTGEKFRVVNARTIRMPLAKFVMPEF